MKEIYERRSIRSYNEKKVSKENLLKLVKAGMNAPSAKNKRPSEFIIIDDENILKKLSSVTPHMFMLEKCSSAVVVFGEELTEFWQQDLSAATQNILLMATSKNISSCWMGIGPNIEKENLVKEILSIPNKKRVLSIVALGYTDKEKAVNDYFDEKKVFFNKFN